MIEDRGAGWVLTINCRVIIWFLTLTGMILICIYGVEESTTLVNELDLVFRGNQRKDISGTWKRLTSPVSRYY